MTDRTAETVRHLRCLLGDDMRPVAELLRGPKKRQPLKRVSEKYCGGITCMPGLSGKCVACADEE